MVRSQVVGQRYNSPSPTKEWQSRQSPKNLGGIQNQGINVTTEQHMSRQQEFNALRQQHQKCHFKASSNHLFSRPQIYLVGSHSQRQQFNPQQQQPQQYTRSLPMQSRERPVMKGRKNLRYIIIDGSNVAMA